MKVTASEIQKRLMAFARGAGDIVLPNFYDGMHECDLYRITGSDLVIEYEIKISRQDYFKDFDKKFYSGTTKHEQIFAGKKCNRFFFVVPENLIQVSEIPKHAGLIYYNGGCSIVKAAPLIHKNKFSNYRMIAHKVAFREEQQRFKVNRIRNIDYEKEISYLQREVKSLQDERRGYQYNRVLVRGALKDIESGNTDEVKRVLSLILNPS